MSANDPVAKGALARPATRLVLGLALLILGASKFVFGVPVSIEGDSLLSPLGTSWVWYGIALSEGAAGIMLACVGPRWLWISCLWAFVGSVAVHAADVLSRGFGATGCGCFGATRHAAGVDLVRTCLFLMMFLSGYRLQEQGGPRPTARRAALFVISGVAFLIAPHLLAHRQTPSETEHALSEASLRALRPSKTATLGGRPGRLQAVLPAAASEATPGPKASEFLVVRVLTVNDDPVRAATLASWVPDPKGGWAEKRPLTPTPGASPGGVLRVPISALPPVPFALEASHPEFASACILVTEQPPIDVELRLSSARSAIVQVISSRDNPISGVVVELRDTESLQAVGDGSLSLPPAKGVSGADGVVRFSQLRAGLTYHVTLSPGQDLARPLMGRITRHILPTEDKVTLVLRPAYALWVHVVDETTGDPIPTATWSPPYDRNRRFAPADRSTGDDRLLGFAGPPPPGDMRQVFVLLGGHASEDSIDYATYAISAPGFESVTVHATAAPISKVVLHGPQVVSMRPTAPLGQLEIQVIGTPRIDSLLVQVGPRTRFGRRVTELLLPRRGKKSCSFSLPAGEYAVSVGGNELEELAEVEPATTSRLELSSSMWAAVSFRANLGDKPPGETASLMVVDKDGNLLFTRSPVPLKEGRTPIYALPREGPLLVSLSVPGFKPKLAKFSPLTKGTEVTEVSIALEALTR